ncbi:hypothetical protein T459_30876 [Capsicum annuum]|uniref:Zeatin O-glucosyltransferase-like n=1 Tax=Capsicum annuum TaxID=4072 RepID=A0A2G2YA73_CAPAN|nr:hypothetical protein T459_30876 [Capsicum annuum]
MHDEFPLLEPHVKLRVRLEHELEFHSGEVINSCKKVEGKNIDLLANAKHKPSWSFGPFHMFLESHDSISSSSSNMTHHECLDFLDKQDASSLIFDSFGEITTLSKEQVNELALGLEQSNHRFIWVLRKGFDDKKKLREKDKMIELPEGFEERVEGRGIVELGSPRRIGNNSNHSNNREDIDGQDRRGRDEAKGSGIKKKDLLAFVIFQFAIVFPYF